MSLHEELLQVARSLADSPSPSEAALRRAISTAYYALFHLLIDAATESALEGTNLPFVQSKLRRTIDHAQMKSVSALFARDPSGGKPDSIAHQFSNAIRTELPELKAIALNFLELYEARQKADYDSEAIPTPQEASDYVATAERAFQNWGGLRAHPIARFYLLSLLFGTKWEQR